MLDKGKCPHPTGMEKILRSCCCYAREKRVYFNVSELPCFCQESTETKSIERKNHAETPRQYMTTLPASLHRTYLYLEENFRAPTGLILKGALLTTFEIKKNGGDRAILYSRTKYLDRIRSRVAPLHNTMLIVLIIIQFVSPSKCATAGRGPSWALTACLSCCSLLAPAFALAGLW